MAVPYNAAPATTPVAIPIEVLRTGLELLELPPTASPPSLLEEDEDDPLLPVPAAESPDVVVCPVRGQVLSSMAMRAPAEEFF